MVWLKLGFGALALTAAAYGGYKYGRAEFERMPYEILLNGNQYVLHEKNGGLTQPIEKGFQLGNIDYRAEGLLAESKQDSGAVEQALLKAFHKHYQPR